jgi:hypothetical protein
VEKVLLAESHDAEHKMLGVLVWHGRDGRAIAIGNRHKVASNRDVPRSPCPMDPVGSIKLPATTVLTEI